MNKLFYLIFLFAFFTLIACEDVEKEEVVEVDSEETIDWHESEDDNDDTTVEGEESIDDIKVENGVYVLNEENFDRFINAKETVLVEFYAPWCGHCKKLAPEFEGAAEELKDETTLGLAKVDATEEKQLAERYEVTGYPKLMVFKAGDQMEYEGGRSKDGIVSTLLELNDPSWSPAKEVALNLSKENFTDVVNAAELTVVMFYTPWCGHCKQLKPEYEKAAKELKERENPIPLAKVDASVETELASQYNIQGYPTLKVFRKGQEFEFKSEARDKWGLISYIEKLTEPASLVLKSVPQLKKLLDSGDAPVIPVAFFSEFEHHLSPIYFDAANSMRDELPFHHSYDAQLATSLNLPANCLVLFTAERFQTKHEPDRRIKEIDEDRVTKDLLEFVQQYRLPLLGEYTSQNGEKVYKESRPLVLFFLTVDWSFEHRQATQQWRLKFADVAVKHPALKFVIADEDANVQLFNQFGFDESGEEINVGVLSEGERKYPMEEMEEYDEDQIDEFLKRFNEGKLKARIRSQAKPVKQQGPVVTVVGKSFEDVVLNKHNDVLIELYAPWCGHCKQLEPLYKQLASKLKAHKQLVVAKMDATANDVPPHYSASGFPTIYFAPANNKEAPLKFTGERSVEELEKFVREHASVAFKTGKEEL